MRYAFSSVLIAAIVIVVASVANCQSANTPQKATGSISGHIIVDGKAAAGIAVAAFSVEASRRVPSTQAKTDSEGSFRLIGLAPGSYQVAILTGNLSGNISTVEGQSLSPSVRVYMVPAERDAGENILRFYAVRPEVNGSFALDHIAPGKYWIVMRPAEVNNSGSTKSSRQDATLRAKLFQEAEVQKKTVTLKPCEEVADFDLPYVAPASPQI